MKTFIKSLNVIGIFLVSQIWGFLLGMFATPSLMSGSSFKPNILVQLIIVLSAMGSVGLTWFLAKKTDIPLPQFKDWTLKATGFVIAATLVTRSLAHLGIYLLHQSNIESTANDAVLNQFFEHFSFPLLFILVAICGPILEEWVFRAGIIGYLFERYPFIGVIISSIIFGAMHMPTNLISWFIYGGIGAVLSLVYYKTKRLELVMVIHILHNAASFWL
ncbi:CPBP family intramembrane glutamic endopeptidase [Streptococcus cameli]